MADIESCWKLSLDPLGTPFVILDFGDLIMDEPRVTDSRGLEIITLVDVDAAFLRPTKGDYFLISFTRVKTYNDDGRARVECLNAHTDRMSMRGREKLRLDILGRDERYYLFASSFTSRFSTKRRLDSPTADIEETCEITATGLTKVIL